MKIAICDDETLFLKKMYHYLWQQPDCSAECFSSSTALLEKYRAGERYDVVFLDIVMSTLNGIDLAKKIRTFDQNAVIIFLTSYPEYATLGYEVNAFRYLLKPITSEALLQVINAIRAKQESSHPLLLKTPECEFLLYPREIQYLEISNKDSILYYKEDVITVRKGLNELETQLSSFSFVRIHRKYLVNLAHVREFDKLQLTLDCGKTLPISRRRWKAFHDALETYIEGAPHL